MKKSILLLSLAATAAFFTGQVAAHACANSSVGLSAQTNPNVGLSAQTNPKKLTKTDRVLKDLSKKGQAR